jgi:hypothetical protein
MFGSVFQGCAPGGEYRLPEEQQELATPLFSNSFETAWRKNTIFLGPGSSRAPAAFMMPGGGRGDAAFPLTVQATIMDSALVDAGIREFAGIAGIDANGLDTYRETYLKRHSLDGCVLVYVDMQTFLAEDYLETERWVLFVEDEHRNQVEPIRIVQHPVLRQAPRLGSAYGVGSRVGFKPVKRILELFFPLKRLPQMKNTIGEFRSLKFVVLDINNSQVRAEGTWDQGLAR